MQSTTQSDSISLFLIDWAFSQIWISFTPIHIQKSSYLPITRINKTIAVAMSETYCWLAAISLIPSSCLGWSSCGGTMPLFSLSVTRRALPWVRSARFFFFSTSPGAATYLCWQQVSIFMLNKIHFLLTRKFPTWTLWKTWPDKIAFGKFFSLLQYTKDDIPHKSTYSPINSSPFSSL